MQITITWTMLIVTPIAYLVARYIYFSFVKWYEGSQDVLNPFVSLSESRADYEWRIGYERGLQEAKIKRRNKKLKRKYEQLHKNYIKKTPNT